MYFTLTMTEEKYGQKNWGLTSGPNDHVSLEDNQKGLWKLKDGSIQNENDLY